MNCQDEGYREQGRWFGINRRHSSGVLVLCWGLFVTLLVGCLADEAVQKEIVWNTSTGVVVNEVYTKGNGPDWVELYNTSDSPVDLSGWAIIDGKKDRTPYVLPSAPALPAGGYHVVRRDEAGDQGFAFGLGTADAVTVLDAGGAVVSHVSWAEGEAPSGRSLGHVFGESGMHTLEMPTPGQWNAPRRECVPSKGALDCGDAPPEGPSVASANLYAEFTVVDLALTISQSDWDQLMEYRQQSLKEYVPCGLIYDGESFDKASLRLKGRVQDWLVPGVPLQFVIRFDLQNPDGRFRGLRRLNLEAAPNLLERRVRNNLALYLLRRARVITSRSNHARLVINGEFTGIYENIEVVDREFLEDRFVDPDGNLFKSGFLETNKNDGDTSGWDTLYALVSDPNAASNPDFVETLESLVNVSAMLDEIATEVLLGAADNFWARGLHPGNSPNYYMYEEPHRLFTLIPWDVDIVINPEKVSSTQNPFEPFDAFGDDKTKSTLSEPWAQIQADPHRRTEFLTKLEALNTSFYMDFVGVVNRYCSLIQDDFILETGKQDDNAISCAEPKTYVQERAAYIQSFLEEEAAHGSF